MSSDPSPSTTNNEGTRPRGRGRGRSRGGFGKYLRARGRGRGTGRPAEFTKRLVLEDEEVVDLEPDSEEAKELERKYARRHLGTNADRYVEPEPALNSDGEPEVEPEVDLSSFLERQRLDGDSHASNLLSKDNDDDEIDESLAQYAPKSSDISKTHKGKVQTIEWDEELENIRREKEEAEANRELKSRFRANAEKKGNRPSRGKAGTSNRGRGKDKDIAEAPPLPTETRVQKDEKEEMEDFLDDLLG